MKKTLAAVIASFAFAIPSVHAQTAQTAPAAAAPDPAALQAAREMLSSMHYEDTAARMMQQISSQMPQMMQQSALAAINGNTKLTPDERKKAIEKLNAELPKMTAAMQSFFGDGTLIRELIAETAPLYARHFTADELHQLAAFYASPLGVKMMAEMPQIAGESMQISQRVMMPRIQAMAAKLVNENVK